MENEHGEEVASGGDDDASNDVVQNGAFRIAGNDYVRVNTNLFEDQGGSHRPITPRSLENVGLKAHSCSNTKPRSAALTKYNASHRKRFKIACCNGYDGLTFA